MSSSDGQDELGAFQVLENQFNTAMESNDVDLIAQQISDDWILVTPERGPIYREAILNVISSGTLTHDWMRKRVVRVKRYGDIALVTGRGQNTGSFKGLPIKGDEWITDVYHLENGGWEQTR